MPKASFSVHEKGDASVKPRLRIFVSSPGDVKAAREIAALTIERLAQDYARFFTIEPYLWEFEAMVASGHFEDSIEPPSAFDVVVLIVWSRLGTSLPERTGVREYRGIDGPAPRLGEQNIRRFGLRLRVGFQLFLVLVATVIGIGAVILIYDAVHSRSVVIDPFEVAPNIAPQVPSGKIVAAGLLDVLTQLQAATLTFAQKRSGCRHQVLSL